MGIQHGECSRRTPWYYCRWVGVHALRKVRLLVAAEGGNLQIVKLEAATVLCTRQLRPEETVICRPDSEMHRYCELRRRYLPSQICWWHVAYSIISDMMHVLGCRVAQLGALHRITHACCLSRGKRDITWIASNA